MIKATSHQQTHTFSLSPSLSNPVLSLSPTAPSICRIALQNVGLHVVIILHSVHFICSLPLLFLLSLLSLPIFVSLSISSIYSYFF